MLNHGSRGLVFLGPYASALTPLHGLSAGLGYLIGDRPDLNGASSTGFPAPEALAPLALDCGYRKSLVIACHEHSQLPDKEKAPDMGALHDALEGLVSAG
jgi:hypothetical protein